MKYSTLTALYSALEKTSKTLEKTALIAEFLKKAPKDELSHLAHLIRGTVSPDYEELELGIGKQLVIKAISQASGVPDTKVNTAWRTLGDIGEVAEQSIKNRKQQTLFSKKITTQEVYADLRKLPTVTGTGSVDRKLALLNRLLISASPAGAKYIL